MLIRFLHQFQNMLSFGLIFLSILALALWMQSLVVTKPDFTAESPKDDDSDFFMENVVLNGGDGDGNRYQIETGRLTHYPFRDGSSLVSPQLTQHKPDGSTQKITSKLGWLDNDRQHLMLSQDVRIRNQGGNQSGSLSITEQLIIHLKQPGDQS